MSQKNIKRELFKQLAFDVCISFYYDKDCISLSFL